MMTRKNRSGCYERKILECRVIEKREKKEIVDKT